MKRLDEEIDMLAAICHEVNRIYCASLGDLSQVAWAKAPEWQRVSARKGVQAHLEDSNLSGEGAHALWCAEKVREGWIYGAKKDPEKKTHPCLVEYQRLPLEQRVKDYLFKSVITGFRATQRFD